jgi:hypothetical protein
MTAVVPKSAAYDVKPQAQTLALYRRLNNLSKNATQQITQNMSKRVKTLALYAKFPACLAHVPKHMIRHALKHLPLCR